MQASTHEQGGMVEVVSVAETLRVWRRRYLRATLLLGLAGGLVWAAVTFALVPRVFESSVFVIPNKSLASNPLSPVAGLMKTEDTTQQVYQDVVHSAPILDACYETWLTGERGLGELPLERRRARISEMITLRSSRGRSGYEIAFRVEGGTALQDVVQRESARSRAAKQLSADVSNWLEAQLAGSISTLQMTGASKAVAFLRQRLGEFADQVDDLESQMADLIAESIESSVPTDATETAKELLRAQTELAKETKTLAARQEMAGWLSGVERSVPEMVVVGRVEEAAPVLEGLRQLKADAERKRTALASDGATAQHPGMIETEGIIAAADEQIARVERAGEGTVVSGTTEGNNALHDRVVAMRLDNEAAIQQSRGLVSALNEQRDRLMKAARLSADTGTRIARVTAETQLVQGGMDAATRQLQQFEAQAAMESLGFVRVSAGDPGVKVAPSTAKALVKGVFICCLLALGAFIVRDARRGIRTLERVMVDDRWDGER